MVSNAFSYAGFALLTRLLAGYLRRLASAAERARQAAAQSAAEAARLAEVDRQRTLLHDNISVLSLLARQDLPPESAEPLRHQAAVLSRKVRAFIDDNDGVPLRSTGPASTRPGPGGDGGPRELIAVVRSAAEGFWELPVTFNLDLARGIALPGPTAAAVEAATATLLHNVRLHAQAHAVVVHADADRAAGEWEITVRDDGRGFDPASTALGFGLRVQVTETLARHRIRVQLDSFPDDGTTVTLRGPWEEPA
ncbi:ATP-binding protein [Kitasatospora sp. NPDC127111]|uniref:ATP-binding protein n=1 Tax=Kitasatospora sp. NPDC127111 TaxID=3345363 RepID=UPI00364498BF